MTTRTGTSVEKTFMVPVLLLFTIYMMQRWFLILIFIKNATSRSLTDGRYTPVVMLFILSFSIL